MKTVKIKELGLVVTGRTPPSSQPEFFNGNVPFLTPTDMSTRRRVKTSRTISSSGASKYSKSILSPGSTAFVCIGATIGKMAQVQVPTLTNQQINSVIPYAGTDADYLYYSLLFNQDSIKQIAGGAATPIVNKTVFENTEISVHSYDDQKRLGRVLSAYDELFENNMMRIKILESMARLFYRHYFEQSEADDWESLPLNDCLLVHRGKSYKSSELSKNEGLPFVNLKCVNREGGFRKDGLKKFTGSYKPTQLVVKGDIVVAVTDMTQERMIVARAARVPSLDGGSGVISMDLVKIEPRDGFERDYIYSLLRWSRFSSEVKNHANGANVLHLLPARITDYQITVAPLNIQQEFAYLVEPIFDLIDNLQLKNESLSKSLNLLLPHLMTDEIRVSRES